MTIQVDPDLAAALTDVRRAYRLLWAFQKRLLGYAETINLALGFRLEWQSQNWSEAGRGNQAWRLLPMLDYEFRGVRRQPDDKYQPRQKNLWATSGSGNLPSP